MMFPKIAIDCLKEIFEGGVIHWHCYASVKLILSRLYFPIAYHGILTHHSPALIAAYLHDAM